MRRNHSNMLIPARFQLRLLQLQRVLLSFYITNGMAAALGLFLISGAVHLLFGAVAAGATSIGVIVCVPPDQAAPIKGKFWHLLPAAVIGIPLFFGVQALRMEPLWLAVLLVPASFLAFLAGAWGKRGLPIAVSAMFAMVFSMANPNHHGVAGAIPSTLFFALGAVAYLLYGTLANHLLNARYRTQMLADTLSILAKLMHSQAEQFILKTSGDRRQREPLLGVLLRQQSALTDQLQSARDILLETPDTPRRQQLVAMLFLVLEIRDHLMASELDLEALRDLTDSFEGMQEIHAVLTAIATDIDALADALTLGKPVVDMPNRRERLEGLGWESALARGLASRVGHVNDEALRLCALASGSAVADPELIQNNWQMFVSASAWSWRPFLSLWRWEAPSLRHAARAALAIGFAYAVTLVLPWGTHDYWVLLTIVVVLRGSLAQTIERRNSRVAGTLVGCVIAGLIISAHFPVLVVLLVLTVAQAFAHGFAVRRYVVTAMAATVLGLVQAHLINSGNSPVFDVIERIGDTLLGAAIAWAFSYVMPSWEKDQVASLVARTLAAQARYTRISLQLAQDPGVRSGPGLAWRLARRECYDSLSALVQATQRALAEPRAVQPPVESLGRILARSYQLLGQLTAIKTMLLVRRERLQLALLEEPLQRATTDITAILAATASTLAPDPHSAGRSLQVTHLPDPFEGDLTPWFLRRLDLAANLATQLAEESRVLVAA